MGKKTNVKVKNILIKALIYITTININVNTDIIIDTNVNANIIIDINVNTNIINDKTIQNNVVIIFNNTISFDLHL